MYGEWIKPREYKFTNAAGEVFYGIAYSMEDVFDLYKMHKATRFKLVDYSANNKSAATD